MFLTFHLHHDLAKPTIYRYFSFRTSFSLVRFKLSLSSNHNIPYDIDVFAQPNFNKIIFQAVCVE